MADNFSAPQETAIRNIVTEISNEEVSNNVKHQLHGIVLVWMLGFFGFIASIGYAAILLISKDIAEEAIKDNFENRIIQLESAVSEAKVPNKSVIATTDVNCPEGWSEFSNANGSIIVGATRNENIGRSSRPEYRGGEALEFDVIDGEIEGIDVEGIELSLYALYFCLKD